jgi:Cu(I)/Ag(I) efflux system membrane fusion protein
MNPETPTPTEAAREQWQAAGGRRPPLGGYAAVAVVSLALGAGVTWLGLRGQRTATPVTATGPAAPAAPAEHAGHAAAGTGAAGDTAAAGAVKAVYISPARQQLIGVRTAEITHRALDTTIRTVGVIAFDETRVAQIHTKISGWIDRVMVDSIGKDVRKGQALFTVYSPELVATQKEYLLALKAQEQFANSQFEETRESARTLLAATRERLHLWDVTDAQVEELTRTGESRKYLTVYSPASGIVLERSAFPGQYVTPEMQTFKIADLSTVWVIGQLFEYELGMIKPGQQAQVQFPYGQAMKTLAGRITFVYPEIDPQTRRAKVRIELKNPGLQFKPESYVTVLVTVSGGHQLAIPKEAVLDNGNKRYAILARADGYFEPREIQIAEPVDDYYPVLSGLEMGDKVVTSAQFLIDSESNLQAAMQAMSLSMPGMDMSGGDDMKGMDMSGKKPPASAPKPLASPPKPPAPHQHKQ